jgi:hypothetical protein
VVEGFLNSFRRLLKQIQISDGSTRLILVL